MSICSAEPSRSPASAAIPSTPHALARELDLIAEAVRSRAGERAGNEALADAIGHELFEERSFRGNREAYGDPENSYLDRVLERRLGLPITLSLVYLEVAERVGLECHGIGFPGNFLVRCGGEDGFFVDPFRGGARPSRDELRSQIERLADAGASGEALLAAVTRRQILQRMLLNLCGVYQQQGDAPPLDRRARAASLPRTVERRPLSRTRAASIPARHRRACPG